MYLFIGSANLGQTDLGQTSSQHEINRWSNTGSQTNSGYGHNSGGQQLNISETGKAFCVSFGKMHSTYYITINFVHHQICIQ